MMMVDVQSQVKVWFPKGNNATIFHSTFYKNLKTERREKYKT